MRVMRWLKPFGFALTVLVLVGALGANPRYLEELAIGGGTGDTDGGADLESDGDIVTDGDISAKGKLTAGKDATRETIIGDNRIQFYEPGADEGQKRIAMKYQVGANEDASAWSVYALTDAAAFLRTMILVDRLGNMDVTATLKADILAIGGGYGSTGASISSAGVGQFNGAITTDASATMDSAVIGGGYGSTGATVSNAGMGQFNGALTTDGALNADSGAFGGGYGSTGATISSAGAGQFNGALTTDGTVNANGAAIGSGGIVAGTDSTTRGTVTLWDGSGGNQPGWARLGTCNGNTYYLFLANDGKLRYHTGVPSANDDGLPMDTGGEGGVPDGTATGQILRWNGANWEAVGHAFTYLESFTEAQLEAKLSDVVNILVETEIDTAAELNALISDGSLFDDDLTDNVLGDIGNVSEAGAAQGYALLSNGAGGWAPGLVEAGSAVTLEYEARKASEGTISKGSVVYVASWNASGWLEVEAAKANSTTTMPALGFAGEDLTSSATGTVIMYGQITGLDTSGFAVGNELYVSAATAGQVTDTAPTGTNLVQMVAQVTRSDASEGILQICGAGRVSNLPNLPENKVWVGNSSGVPTETTLATGAITDIDFSGISANDLARWDGSKLVDTSAIWCDGTDSGVTGDFKVLADNEVIFGDNKYRYRYNSTSGKAEICDSATNVLWWLKDTGNQGDMGIIGDLFLLNNNYIGYGTGALYRLGYDEAVDDRWELTDADGNELLTAKDAGTVGNVWVSGTFGADGATTLGDNLDVAGTIEAGSGDTQLTDATGEILDAALSSNVAHLNVAETLAAQWDFSSYQLTDADVSNTLTASKFVGTGSTSDAVDLATSEVNGNLPGGQVDIAGTDDATAIATTDTFLVNQSGTVKEMTHANVFHFWDNFQLGPGSAVLDDSVPPESVTWDSDPKRIRLLKFAGDTANEKCQWTWTLPADYVAETAVKVRVSWTCQSGGASGDNVRFHIRAHACSDDDAIDAAFGTAVNCDDVWIADGDRHLTAEASLTIGGTPQPLDDVTFELERDYDYAGGGQAMDVDASFLNLIGRYEAKKVAAP